MEFNKELHRRLDSIFELYNLEVIEEYSGFLKVKSPHLVMSFSHDKRENSFAFFIGHRDADYLVDAEVSELLFRVKDCKIFLSSETSMEEFTNNVITLLESHEGKKLLNGETYKLSDVKKHVSLRAKNYTNNLLNNQYLNAAIRSWEEKDYRGFIDNLSHADKSKLPLSYKLKLRIAFQKTGQLN
jgi:hypothetical protein